MTMPNFDVALEISRLVSPPANSANPANSEVTLATLATLAGGQPRFEALPPQKQIREFSSLHLHKGRGVIAPVSARPALDETGLTWIVWPEDETITNYDARWSAFDLADVCRHFGVKVVRANERVIAIYPPALESELVAYASELLDEARSYLTTNIDKLPILTPSEAVKVIKDVMRQHQGLRFCRGEDGSRWPLYPTTWTTEQCMVVQSLWFAAGNALDHDNFILVEEK